MRFSGFWLVFLAPLSVGSAAADNLFLRTGKTLKIESLSCDARVCVAALRGGYVEVRAGDVLRVEPDEDVDPEISAIPGPGRPVEEKAVESIEGMMAKAARKYALPRSLVRAVAKAESAFDPAALSPKGAQGVMQLMPGTARKLGVRNAFDPAENIDGGARLLRQLLEKYEGRVAEALAAYNAGPGAVARHKGIPPFRETRRYVRKVVKDFEEGEEGNPGSSPQMKK